jgi:hypothetical protein
MRISETVWKAGERCGTYLHAEQQSQQERHCRLQRICLCARSPVERDFVRNLYIRRVSHIIAATSSIRDVTDLCKDRVDDLCNKVSMVHKTVAGKSILTTTTMLAKTA